MPVCGFTWPTLNVCIAIHPRVAHEQSRTIEVERAFSMLQRLAVEQLLLMNEVVVTGSLG